MPENILRGLIAASALCAAAAGQVGSSPSPAPSLRPACSVRFDTLTGICQADGQSVQCTDPRTGWFEFSSIEIPAAASCTVVGPRALLLHASGNVAIGCDLDLSGEAAVVPASGGGGGGTLLVLAGGDLRVASITLRGGSGATGIPSGGGGGGGGFVELVSDGILTIGGIIDTEGGRAGSGASMGDAGECGAVSLAGRRGVNIGEAVRHFRRLLICVPRPRSGAIERYFEAATRCGGVPLGSVLAAEWPVQEPLCTSDLAALHRAARGGDVAGLDGVAVPRARWNFLGTDGSAVQCDEAGTFELVEQERTRDCFPAALLMELQHLGKLFVASGGTVRIWPSYADVRALTHESGVADRLNKGGMVHGQTGLWAANSLAERMGLPWRFEPGRATRAEDLVDALRWRLPVIVTVTKQVLPRSIAQPTNLVIEVAQGPGAIVEGAGRLIERVPRVGKYVGSVVKWIGQAAQPADYVLPEENVYSHYLHALVLVSADPTNDIYWFADPWAGLLGTGRAKLVPKTAAELREHFIEYETSGIGATRVVDSWKELAPPGSFLIPVSIGASVGRIQSDTTGGH